MYIYSMLYVLLMWSRCQELRLILLWSLLNVSSMETLGPKVNAAHKTHSVSDSCNYCHIELVLGVLRSQFQVYMCV